MAIDPQTPTPCTIRDAIMPTDDQPGELLYLGDNGEWLVTGGHLDPVEFTQRVLDRLIDEVGRGDAFRQLGFFDYEVPVPNKVTAGGVWDEAISNVAHRWAIEVPWHGDTALLWRVAAADAEAAGITPAPDGGEVVITENHPGAFPVTEFAMDA